MNFLFHLVRVGSIEKSETGDFGIVISVLDSFIKIMILIGDFK